MPNGISKVTGRTYLGSIMYMLSKLQKLSDEQLDADGLWDDLKDADRALDDAYDIAEENGFLNG